MTGSARIIVFPTHNTKRCRSRHLPPLLAFTGDLAGLITANTLVVCDAENILISARDHGFIIDFEALGNLLSPAGNSTQLHAAFSRRVGDTRLETLFVDTGWQIHTRDIVWVSGPYGPSKRANADTLFATTTGILVAAYRPDSLLLLTGDGDLACDTAQAILNLIPNPPRISTLAIPGSVSSRLNPANNPIFHAHVLLGQDVAIAKEC